MFLIDVAAKVFFLAKITKNYIAISLRQIAIFCGFFAI